MYSIWRSTQPSFKRPLPLVTASMLMINLIIYTLPHLKDLSRKAAICQKLKDGNEELYSHLGLVNEYIEQLYKIDKRKAVIAAYIPTQLAWFYNAPYATAVVCIVLYSGGLSKLYHLVN